MGARGEDSRAMRLLGAWLHDLDPFVVRFTDGFGVRWYGLSYVAGFIAAWLVLKALARRGLILVRPKRIADLILWVIVGTLAGGRLGYVLFYNPPLLWEFRGSAPWWGVLAIHEGGMASHGGMIGVILACAFFARAERVPRLHVMDCMALVAPIGICFGRIANFINGELLGRIVAPPGEPAPWWAVKYPQELLEGRQAPALTPEQLSELAQLLAEAAGPGHVDRTGVQRVLDALHAGDAEVARRLEPLISARHPSQIYQALAEGLLLFLLLWAMWARPRRPGMITATFLIVYGVGRIATEFVRLPDAHLTVARIAGLSRGQWLSVAMILGGAGIAWWVWTRSKAERVGGWAGRSKTWKVESKEERATGIVERET